MRGSPAGQGKSPQPKCVALQQSNQLSPMFLSPSPCHPTYPSLTLGILDSPVPHRQSKNRQFWRVQQQATTPHHGRARKPGKSADLESLNDGLSRANLTLSGETDRDQAGTERCPMILPGGLLLLPCSLSTRRTLAGVPWQRRSTGPTRIVIRSVHSCIT